MTVFFSYSHHFYEISTGKTSQLVNSRAAAIDNMNIGSRPPTHNERCHYPELHGRKDGTSAKSLATDMIFFVI